MATYKTSILWKNQTKDVFLVDIPASISLAQCLSSQGDKHAGSGSGSEFEHPYKRQKTQHEPKGRKILSTPPLTRPYPTPPEPKTEKAKARVLQGIPPPERAFHEDVIAPLVTSGLDAIREQWTGEWCLDRVLHSGEEKGDGFGEMGGSDSGLEGGKSQGPPVILSSTSENIFSSMDELRGVYVQNPSMESSVLCVLGPDSVPIQDSGPGRRFTIPPLSTFLLSTIPSTPAKSLVPGLDNQKFNLIVLDPPWPNRSVRRSGHYHTQSYTDMDALTETMKRILQTHLSSASDLDLDLDLGRDKDRNRDSTTEAKVAAIWVTNSYKARMAAYDAIHAAGLVVAEEWAWVKMAINGEAVLPVSGVWRKPYEVLVIGMPDSSDTLGSGSKVRRRVVAAVPDVHSRKPNLKELFEEVFFTSGSYTALEVFARNLTAGWWGCGDEVLRFNAEEWWI